MGKKNLIAIQPPGGGRVKVMKLKAGVPPHVFIGDKDSGKGFISAVVLLRSRGIYWCFHYLAFKLKDTIKPNHMFNPIVLTEPWIEVPGAPEDSPANAVKFLQTFRRQANKFSGEEEFLLATEKFEYEKITEILNKTYDDMWAFSIRKPTGPSEYPVSLEQAVNYIFLENRDALLDLNFKKNIPFTLK